MMTYHYSLLYGQLNLSIFNIDPYASRLKRVHQTLQIQANRVKIYNAPETRGFENARMHDSYHGCIPKHLSTIIFSFLLRKTIAHKWTSPWWIEDDRNVVCRAKTPKEACTWSSIRLAMHPHQRPHRTSKVQRGNYEIVHCQRNWIYHAGGRNFIAIFCDGTCTIFDGETKTSTGKQQKQGGERGETQTWRGNRFSWRVILVPGWAVFQCGRH